MIYGCIGEKLSHSFSKEIHTELFSYEYELCEVERENLESFMLKKDFKAINVTIPYKSDVIPYLSEISDTAKAIGAVNTIVNDNGTLKGYNTDFYGMKSLIERNEICLEGKKTLILGSGGTSKTAFAVAKSLKAKEIYVVSRKSGNGCVSYQEAKEKHSDAEVIINTTPCGMYPNIAVSAVEVEDFPKLYAVVDAVYNPLRSKIVCDARKKGVKAVGGLYMLVAQATFAAEKFIGEKLNISEIERVYRNLVCQKQNIVLVGMPSSGKTTVGKLISEKLNMQFVDTDDLIVKKEGTPIPKIFEKHGEDYFRKIESEIIFEVSKRQNCVIATGGGAVLNSLNPYHLIENGRIYFLDRPLSSLLPTEDRPLSSDFEALKKIYTERYDIYLSCADCHIKDMGSAEKNAEKIIEDFKNENTCD